MHRRTKEPEHMILISDYLLKQAVKCDCCKQEWFPVTFNGAFWVNEPSAEGAPMFTQYVVKEWHKLQVI